MNTISIGVAQIEDALKISLVLKAVYVQTYATEGVSTEFANFMDHRFSEKYIENCIRENPAQLLIAKYKGNPIGVAEIIYHTNCPIRKIPVAELSKLYVLQRFYGKGVGYALLQASEKAVRDKGIRDFNLEVYCKNDRAVSFYQRQKYTSIGTVFFQMQVNRYENFVMTKVLDQ